MRTLLLLVIPLSVGLSSCGGADSVPRAQFDRLQREADSLRRVLDDAVNGPARLLAEARSHLEEGALAESRSTAQRLIAKHEGSPEAKEGALLLTKIEAESTKRANEEAREIEAALAGMTKERDEMRSITFWKDRAAPRFVNSRSWIGAYIAASDAAKPVLRLQITYTADDWLFIERYLIKVDGVDHRFVPESFGTDAVERDNGGGGIWEWWDVAADEQQTAFLRSLAASQKATIRYDGKQYYRDRTISPSEREALRRTLKAFDVLVARSGAQQ